MTHTTDTFSGYSPVINFIFYMGAILCGVFFIHPAFLACGVVLSATYYLTIRGAAALKLIIGLLPVWAAITLINPIFNTNGQQVLFTYLNGRPYTLEAIYYGLALGAMFVAIILWFASYNSVMTSDKFIYLFGRLIPAASLILTMVLRLVPSYQRKIRQIANARKCIGKGADSDDKREKAEDGLTILSALTTWAFEGGIVTADSMRCRGYGCGKRTNFSIYTFGARDRLLLLFMAVMLAIIFTAAAKGGMQASYTPDLMITGSPWTIIGCIAYMIFLSIPTALNLLEELTWHILRSRV